MRLLVTNDDGIDSEGLHALARAMVGLDHEVFVVAPDHDASGTGASLGQLASSQRLETRRADLPGLPGVDAFALPGPPGLCVLAAQLGAFGPPPELVVSGINPGLNTGRAVLHSGTVGATLTAQNFGMSGLAVSVQWVEPFQWETAAALAAEVLDRVIAAPARSVLNLNVPALPRDEVKGIRWARLATFGEVRTALTARHDDHVVFELQDSATEPPPDTDLGTVRQGYASLTALVGVVEAWPAEADLTATGPELALGSQLVPGAELHPVHTVPDPDADARLHRLRLAAD